MDATRQFGPADGHCPTARADDQHVTTQFGARPRRHESRPARSKQHADFRSTIRHGASGLRAGPGGAMRHAHEYGVTSETLLRR
jgi:hypothetical protein